MSRCSPHQRRGAPEDWRLAMKVTHAARTLQVEFQLPVEIRSHFQIGFVSAHANIGYISVFVYVLNQSEPGLARRRSIRLALQPTILHPRDHREGEHARARSLGPCFRMIDELAPQSVIALILQQRGHHLLVTCEYPRVPRMILRERAQ